MVVSPSLDEPEPEGDLMRQVIVTGGGTGIGKAIAAVFAQADDQVVITGRRPRPLTETATGLGGNVRAVSFDASDPAQIEAALAELPEVVDVLVNNAGGNTSIGAAEPASLAEHATAWRPISTATCSPRS
jgi:3-oxoacyl-[acyl-carrier protein] reductase